MGKNYDLDRFKKMQECSYHNALLEIRKGKKTGHWMWYIFPQIVGLGRTYMANYYGIEDLEEAKSYLADDYLGGNLREISNALLELESNDAYEIFGSPDELKLRSCMTLFKHAGKDEVFGKVLDKYYGGKEDVRTLEIIGREGIWNIEDTKG